MVVLGELLGVVEWLGVAVILAGECLAQTSSLRAAYVHVEPEVSTLIVVADAGRVYAFYARYAAGSASTVPSGNARRKSQRETGPAMSRFHGSAATKFHGMFAIHVGRIMAGSPTCVNASRAT